MPSNLPIPPLLQPFTLSTSPISSSPKRKIFTATDLSPWFSSQAFANLESFTLELCHAVEGKRLEEKCYESEITRKAVSFLREAEAWVDEVPLQTTPQRFGNKAFRDWLTRVEERNDGFQKSLLSTSSSSSSDPNQPSIISELSFNFITSFGSGARLDYGTGHELSFLLWLLSLRLLGISTPDDDQAIVLRIFSAYIDLVRKLQRVFKLEPAGSKGVWGLDDHQHIVYLFGASQLIDHSSLRPSHILQPRSLHPLASSYLLPSSILHITTLKTGPFCEHSPLLHQIASTVPNWAKIQSGLWKMYREEVLGKVPVVQHLRFGQLIRWTSRENGEQLESTGDGKEEEEEGRDNSESDAPVGLEAPWIKPNASNFNSSTSHAASRRTPFTVSSPGTRTPSQPIPFAPPTLFPSRNSNSGNRSVRTTLADEGGAAAQSSPFGILGSATANHRQDSDSTRSGVDQVGTKAPWAK